MIDLINNIASQVIKLIKFIGGEDGWKLFFSAIIVVSFFVVLWLSILENSKKNNKRKF